MSTSDKTSSNLFQRLNIRFPWLKIVTVVVICLIALLDLMRLTISGVVDANTIKIAPMAKHVKITSRDLEGKKLVALTFDDGPSTETTPRLIDILEKREVPATFFMLGSKARNNPELVKQVLKKGNEIGSHTMYHQNLIRISAEAAEADINEAKGVMSSILGKDVTLTRPPYGNYNDVVQRATGTPLILWSVDTMDWSNGDINSIMGLTMSEVYDGGIILMHDIYNTTVDAVPKLIDTLRDNGYEFVTVSELAEKRGAALTAGTVYRSMKP